MKLVAGGIWALLACAACGGGSATEHVVGPAPIAPADAPASTVSELDEAVMILAHTKADLPPPSPPEQWLRGSTHVHARPSGDSSTPISDVIGWYETHNYDFIAITDHNRISEIDATSDTSGSPVIHTSSTGLIVFAGSELTHNSVNCEPQGMPNRKCRIHVNLIGPTARPRGRFDWARRDTNDRVLKYEAALTAAKTLGGIPQMNHPQWFWGTTPDVLVEVAQRGMVLYELANAQFPKWNAGDKDHPSTEALWDAALVRGATVWGVASDDAHDYDAVPGKGKLFPGGGWIVVKSRRDPQAILDAIAAGRFYSSTGVVLDRAEVENNELIVEVAREDAPTSIDLVENGRVVATVPGKSARRAVPATGYLRAVVTRSDGAKAWVQPARR